MAFWILAISYWIHLLATAVWVGVLVLLGVLAWPALRQGTLTNNQWLRWQKRLMPWINGSLVLLLISGFYQMTNDPHYNGFMVIDSIWAWAMLIKHVAFGLLLGIMAMLQFSVYPAIERTAVLAQTRPKVAEADQVKQTQQERRLLQTNAACGLVILLCTAVATAVS